MNFAILIWNIAKSNYKRLAELHCNLRLLTCSREITVSLLSAARFVFRRLDYFYFQILIVEIGTQGVHITGLHIIKFYQESTNSPKENK